ncbi:o-succinylbenzoate synthase [Pelagicoccus albus]|uniref:o-succinylbenzoate synthase n=1 Tax=Pelagicoccus albus TaxID=415222 RepID=A0A7X1B7A3_9BACT|nr:o-succinylbenzoate synthase [Pelagicoccus albus]MBC2605715.1 o-succinylbenzoate synthase [Pelagicoccus albus]
MVRFQYKAYRRSFAGDFSNARESFAKREGAIVRLEDKDGRVGFGEAAPIPSFGSESFASLIAAAVAIEERVDFESLLPRLKGYPCLSWALGTAHAMIEREGTWPSFDKPRAICGLVSDICDSEAISERVKLHYQCLKFKIGKLSMLEEQRALDRVMDICEGKLKIRLDANGSLDFRSAAGWLEHAAGLPVEFIEQPLPMGQEKEMMRLAADFPAPIALDESVCSVDDFKRCRDAQWPGIFVLKPSLSGAFRELRDELEGSGDEIVFSSALETKVGAANAIGLALSSSTSQRALGFGVESLFADRNIGLELGPFLQPGGLPNTEELEQLWNQI